MLSYYANLENDPNNFVQASKTIQQNFNRKTIDNLKQVATPSESGIAPKNELEEFNANLIEINTYITQLKTYVGDNLNKEFILQNRDVKQQNDEIDYQDQQGQATGETKRRIIDKTTFSNIIDKEAKRVGQLPSLNKINLHSSNQDSFKGSGLSGGGLAEQEQLKEEIDEQEQYITNIKELIKAFVNITKIIETTTVGADRDTAIAEKEAMITTAQSNGNEYPNFPADDDIDVIHPYLIGLIDERREIIKTKKQELATDLGETISEKEAPSKLKITELQQILDNLDAMSESDFKALKKQLQVGPATKKATIKKKLEKEISVLQQAGEAETSIETGELSELQQTLAELDAQKEEEKQQILHEYEVAAEEVRRGIEAIQQEIIDRQNEIAEQARQDAIQAQEAQRQIDEARGRERQRLKEEQALLLIQTRARMRIAKEELRKVKEEALEKKREIEEFEKRRDEEIKLLFEEAEKEAVEAEREEAIRTRKTVGAIASSVPSVNPIIGTITKLISLISKLGILFNGRIKRNINLLDRMSVEEMITNFNKVVSNLETINLNYIIVGIENGFEMLSSLFSTLNKISDGINIGVQSYTASVKGGSRFINNHLQYFKTKGMSSNPHPYLYLM